MHKSLFAALIWAALCVVGFCGPATALEIALLDTLSGGAKRVAWLADTQTFYLPAPDNQAKLIAYQWQDGTLVQNGAVDLTDFGVPQAVSASPDGGMLAITSGQTPARKGKLLWMHGDGSLRGIVDAGYSPVDLSIAPDGRFVTVANSGAPVPGGQIDPVGSVVLYDLPSLAPHIVGFAGFEQDGLDASIYLPEANTGQLNMQALAPSRVVVGPNSARIYALLQGNNALAVIDAHSGDLLDLKGLGFQDFSGRIFDISDADGAIKMGKWPIQTLNQPADIVAFQANDQTILATANQGQLDGFEPNDTTALKTNDLRRIASMVLDSELFSVINELRGDSQMGRFVVSASASDTDGDGDADRLIGFGGRSFSLLDAGGAQIYDSGSRISQFLAAARPTRFNALEPDTPADAASPLRGSAPQSIAVLETFGARYVFVGLGSGGLASFDISNTGKVRWAGFLDLVDADGMPFAADGLMAISRQHTPNGVDWLVAYDKAEQRSLIYALR